MQKMIRAAAGVAALAMLAACGGDKAPADSDKVAPAAGKAAAARTAAEPAKSTAKATGDEGTKKAAPTKAAPAPTRVAAPPATKTAAAPAKGAAAPAKGAPAPSKVAAAAPAKAAAKAPAKAAAPAHDMSKMSGPMPMAAKSGDPNSWAELNAFHDVLQAAWHPVANGDLKPARASGAQLLAAALAWRQSRGPAKCDNAALRAGMAEFIADARSYADAVKRDASDDAVTVTLRRTHTDFEAIAEPCMMGAMGDMKGMKKP